MTAWWRSAATQYLWWQVAELGFDAFMVRMRSRG